MQGKNLVSLIIILTYMSHIVSTEHGIFYWGSYARLVNI